MTGVELIAKIKALVERLKATNPSEYNYQNAEGYVWALDDILSFLSTLESEKSMNQEGLEEEIKRYGEKNMFNIPTFQQVARHFAQWQKEKDDKELSEKIAAAYQLGLADKEKQMMKKAVEGTIDYVYDEEGDVHKAIRLDWLVGDFGNKVHIIIVKEDSNE